MHVSTIARAGILALLLGLPAAAAPALDLAQVVPGPVHLGLLLDLQKIRAEAPDLLREGWLADLLDRAAALGWTDLRAAAPRLGVGANLEGRALRDVMLVGRSPRPLRPLVRQVADRLGVDVEERAYRGVPFVVLPDAPGGAVEVTDFGPALSFLSWDRAGAPRLGPWTVDTLAGRTPSLGATHGVALDPETLLIGAGNVPVQLRRALARRPGLEGLRFLAQVAVAWRTTGGQARLGAELRARTSIGARLLARAVRAGLERWKARVEDPDLRELLEKVQVERVGTRVQVFLVLAWPEAVEAVRLLGALPARVP